MKYGILSTVSVLTLLGTLASDCQAQKKPEALTIEKVVGSIDLAKNALLKTQAADGSWDAGEGHVLGVTSLATMALLNSGMTKDDPKIRKALKYLREAQTPSLTYEVSLMLMTFALARDPKDRLRMQKMAAQIEKAQIKNGIMSLQPQLARTWCVPKFRKNRDTIANSYNWSF